MCRQGAKYGASSGKAVGIEVEGKSVVPAGRV